jgi:uncharacterized protein DUF5818
MSKRKVYRVENVTLQTLKPLPPILVVEAEGEVLSSGWRDPELIPHVYITPPADGIYELELVATPPSGPDNPVITPVDASYHWQGSPPDLLGVRVVAETNSKTALLYESGLTVVERGVLTDEGVECQAFRSDEGRLFTLIGDLHGYLPGDRVVVVGTVAPVSYCMQGITLAVLYIRRENKKASRAA